MNVKTLTMSAAFAALPFIYLTAQNADDSARVRYIDRYKFIAVREMERSGIPASVKLALAIWETDAGRNALVKATNNHFGLKCGADWNGGTYFSSASETDNQGTAIKSCYREYKDAEASYQGHSAYLSDPLKANRYGFLFRLNPKDYTAWVNGLQRVGYSTTPNFSDALLKMIVSYRLQDYDSKRSSETLEPSGQIAQKGFTYVNDVKVVYTAPGMTLEQVAGRYGVSVRDLQQFNEEIGAANRELHENTPIFLGQKKKANHKKEKFHLVKPFETMYDVSQAYGIREASLYKKNKMALGMQPAVGQRLLLRKGWFETVHTPALRDTSGEWMLQNVGAAASAPVLAGATDYNKNGAIINPYDSLVNMGVEGPKTTYETERPNYSFPSTAIGTGAGAVHNGAATGGVYGRASTPNGYPPPRKVPRPAVRENNAVVTSYKPAFAPPRKTIAANPGVRPPVHSAGATATGAYHVVAPKENLYRISKLYGTTVESIKKLNGLPDETIRIGQKLRIK